MPRMISLPFRFDAGGALASTSSPLDQLSHRVFSVIATQPGERVMRPTYGTDMASMVFEEIDDELQDLLTLEAGAALATFEPDAVLVGIEVESTDEYGRVQARIDFAPAGAEDNPGLALSSVRVGIATDNDFVSLDGGQ